jgi:hypothetical protein
MIAWSLAALALLALAALPLDTSRAELVAQPELTPTATSTATATPLSTIAVGSATPIVCGQAIGGTTVGATNNVSAYSCAPWLPATGPEQVFALSLQAGANVDALLSDLSSDLDLFVLTGPNPASCITFGDNAISLAGAAAPYQLNLWCPLAITSTPTPTVTPTITPRPTALRRYFPLVLQSSLERRR